MKVSLFFATAVAVVCGSLVGPFSPSAQAQGGAVPAGHKIAVVDVSIVFKQHQRFLARTEMFKKQVQAAEAALKKEYEVINALAQQLEGRTPGSPDYKTMEQRVARDKVDWQLRGQTQRKELMEEEGRIYFQTYRELDDAVKRFAMHNGIALVLRFASDVVDNPDDRNEIVKGINKSVVYVHPDLNITHLILQELNRSGPPVTGGNPGAVPQGVGPRPVGAAPRPGVQR
ncbi:MAG: OmpH family outer membrane protein [Pirellulales bacterium]